EEHAEDVRLPRALRGGRGAHPRGVRGRPEGAAQEKISPGLVTAEATRAGGRRLGFWLVTAAALCWSSGGLIARLAATDAWTTVFWRSVFCAAFLLVAVVLTQRGRLGRIVGVDVWPGMLLDVFFAAESTTLLAA